MKFDQRHVHEPFVLAALAIALTAGFGYAAIIVAAFAFRWQMGTWWIAMVQAHGHAQLFGWTGLFIVGTALLFLPRLRGTILARIELASWCLASLVAGIVLRALTQPLGTVIPQGSSFDALGRFGTMLSGVLETIGVALFSVMIVASFRRARPIVGDAPILPVRPFLAIAFVSLLAATLLNLFLSISTALSPTAFVFPTMLDTALTMLMIHGFVLPITIVMAVRTLPLFMRLAPPPKRSLLPLSIIYVIALVLRLLEQPFFSPLGQISEGIGLLVFIWQLDVLLRRKSPWTTTRTPPPPNYVETRKPTRPGYPDYGEFGRFELLILSSYAWLVFACIAMIIDGTSHILGLPAQLNPDIERHALTVGFITLLIFGMAQRMLPGFSAKSRVSSPRLVLATFWLGNLAALTRVIPLFAPDAIGMNIALGMSGAIGWFAVACLAVNMWYTFK
jgi:uncharacterized protein involved in response to NO